MKIKVYLFFGQCIILCGKYEFIETKALSGRNVRNANIREFSYVVSIMEINAENPQSGGEHFCTGVLITRKDVLSAAHCLYEKELNHVQILIGTIDLRIGEKFHPFWWMDFDNWAAANHINNNWALNDVINIRLIELVSNNLYPVRLSSLKTEEMYGAEVMTAGWSMINNSLAFNLMKVATLQVLTNLQCTSKVEKAGGERVVLDRRFMCTTAKPYIILVIGDSGGPLLFRNRLIGINKGTAPTTNNTNPSNLVNVHLGTYYYRHYINSMKNLF